MSVSALEIEVAYASAQRQWLVTVTVPENTTVADAIAAANFQDLPNFPTLAGNVGIFARACQLSDVLKHGDRVEIYRPLIADPMLQRRNRAVVAKKAAVKNLAAQKGML